MKPLGRTNIQAMPEPSMSFFPARCHRCSRLAAASSAPGRSHDRAVPFAQLQRQRGQRVQALHAKQSRVEGLRLVHVTDHELHAGARLAGCRPLRHAPGRVPANPPSRAERRRGGRPSRSRRSPGSLRAFVQCCDLPPVSLDPPVSDPAQTAVLCCAVTCGSMTAPPTR